MDAPSESSALSITAIVLSVGGIILGAINHKRVRSTCCGKKMDASLDIETTTPQGVPVKLQTPPPSA
jgi:hypothetical protein